MAFCRVTYQDIEGIEHSVDVEAESLYEAVACAVNRFRRDDDWGMPPPRDCQFRVRVLTDAPVTYPVSLRKVEDFARHGIAKGPHDIVRKNRMRELLGVTSDR